ncbi:hypothetical protein, partial [Propionivibrio sp.]|uniref:hypothetical protein n=1 Tax=Propionivibrio sp. TaxID=2212460 RepID=UPI003BF16C94
FSLPVDVHGATSTPTAAPSTRGEADSRIMEKDLQRLPWKQFRSVIESVPQLKAGVEAYGPIGWQFVQANYGTYGWKKHIDKLDDTQKKRLAELIHAAKGTR